MLSGLYISAAGLQARRICYQAVIANNLANAQNERI